VKENGSPNRYTWKQVQDYSSHIHCLTVQLQRLNQMKRSTIPS
jgi:hypothetical protein